MSSHHSSHFQYTVKGYWRSSATWRVRIALHMKQIPFEYQAVHLVKNGGEQHQDEFKHLSPLAQVPVLHYQDAQGNQRHLTQSMAMFEWLEHMHPHHAIFPKDPWHKALSIQYAEVVNAGIQPIQNLYVLNYIKHNYQQDHLAWGKHFIQRGLQALEHMYATRQEMKASPFLVGDQPTVADFCLIPQLYNARRFKVDLQSMPHLCAIEQACQALPAFQQAHPDQQSDAVLS